MVAYLFPGQGSQFIGMGRDLYQNSTIAKELFDEACEIIGFDICKIMFEGSEEELKQTHITQLALFLHSVIDFKASHTDIVPDMAAGHSLGELSALTAMGTFTFSDGVKLVKQRAEAMQKACEQTPSTMAAILNLQAETIEEVCSHIEGVVAANYNSPEQIVISGSIEAVNRACEELKRLGAKRCLPLKVGGAFHSPYMLSAKEALCEVIDSIYFGEPVCPIYQNVSALPTTNPDTLKANLKAQLTSPVLWSKSVQNMVSDGATEFIELAPGKVLTGLIKKIVK